MGAAGMAKAGGFKSLKHLAEYSNNDRRKLETLFYSNIDFYRSFVKDWAGKLLTDNIG
jgi:hypothetical protein